MRLLILYIGFLITTLFFLLIVRTFNLALPLQVTSQQANQLAVTGVGKADVVPDQGTVNASISVTDASSQQDAQSQMNKVNDAVIAAVEKLGIAKKDIQTTQYQINPNYDYTTGSQKSNGFNGTASVTVTVRDFSKVTQVIDAATAAGATDVSDSGRTVSNPEKYQEQARENAIADAKAQAKKIADTLGIHLGRVVNFVEESPSVPRPIYNSMAMPATAQDAKTTIEPGTQTVTSTVTLYFERN